MSTRMPTRMLSTATMTVIAGLIVQEHCSVHYTDMVGWVVMGVIFSFTTACGIGANDVANSFSTSVGSKVITLKQATIIAAICEFAGATLVGKGVTKTVKKKIIDPKYWADDPEHLMLGMVSTLVGCTLWLALATKFKLPVSTTHTVVGGLLGFALFTKPEAIKMDKLTLIFASWVAAPGLSGCMGAVVFYLYRRFVLRAQDSLEMARKSMPLVMFFVFWVAFTFLAIKGPSELKKEMEDSDNDGNKKETEDRLIAMAWACLCAIIATIPVIYGFVPRLYKKVLAKDVHEFPWHIEPKDDGGENIVVEVIKAPEGGDVEMIKKAPEGGELKQPPIEMTKPEDPEAKGKKEEPCQKTARAHGAERFDERTEGLVSFLQVVTACSDSFAHGANDTANAIGPFAALWSLYRHGEMTDDIPFWIMLVGGAGLVFGLSIWGQIIIKALGTDLCLITPSRGFAIKVSSSFMIIIMSILDIPSSTTHCQVGATVAVALLEGRKEAINLPMIMKVCFGWVLTLVIAALTSGIIYLILAAIVC